MFYGRNCLESCSGNCYVSKSCDKKTGVCDGGCVEGWKPPLCNKGIYYTILVHTFFFLDKNIKALVLMY